MKKTFTILALLQGLAAFSQITTQTINTSSSVTANSQTITTYTVLTTNTKDVSLLGFSFTNANSAFMTNTTISTPGATTDSILRASSSLPGSDFHLAKNINVGFYDSLKVDVKAGAIGTSSFEISIANFYTLNVLPSTLGNNANWQTYSITSANTNTALNTYSLNFKCDLTNSGDAYITRLKITTYSSSIHSYTTNAPTTTGIKTLVNTDLNLFVTDNIIKSNLNNDHLILIVFDLFGKQVLKTALKNEIETNLSPGIYILNVFNSKNDLIERKRVLITKR